MPLYCLQTDVQGCQDIALVCWLTFDPFVIKDGRQWDVLLFIMFAAICTGVRQQMCNLETAELQ